MNQENSSTVLIVDSDEEVLITLEQLLESEGIGTTTTWSGQHALELSKSGSFKLLLIGDRLTELSCEQLLRELQRQGSDASILVMESTGPRTPSAAIYFASLGAAATVRKREFGKVLETAKALLANQWGTPARAA